MTCRSPGDALGHFLDARGVDAAVLEQFRERPPGHLAAHGVEGGDHDRLRRVVDDQVDAGGLLERADVPPLAADDPPLHVVRRQRHGGDEPLRDVIRRAPLDGGGEDFAGAAIGIFLDFRLDLARAAVRGVSHLLLNGGEQERPCIVARQVRDTLQLGDLPGAQRLRFRADGAHLLLAGVEVVVALLQLRRLAIERLFLLLDAALLPLRVGALLLQFSLDLLAQVERISLGGERQFPLLRLRCFDNLLGVGLGQQSFVASFGIFDARSNHPSRRKPDGEPDQAHQYCDDCHLKSSLRVRCVYRSAGAHPGHLHGETFVGAVANRRGARRAGCT